MTPCEGGGGGGGCDGFLDLDLFFFWRDVSLGVYVWQRESHSVCSASRLVCKRKHLTETETEAETEADTEAEAERVVWLGGEISVNETDRERN